MYSLPRNQTRKKLDSLRTVTYEPPVSILHMYEEVPTLCEIDIREFEKLAVERYELLRIIQETKISNEWEQLVKTSVKEKGLRSYFYFFDLGSTGGLTEKDSKRNDHISHFILRLANCKSEELQKIFIEQETRLFRLKYAFLKAEAKKDLSREYETVTLLEKLMNKEELIECNPNIDVDSCDFYLVPFYYAKESVAERYVYVDKGFAYLPADRFDEYLGCVFGKKLKTALQEMHSNCLDSDERIENIFKNLELVAIDHQMFANSSDVSIENLNEYSERNFPICMQHLHKELITKQHLRHEARLQYGRFLKNAGFDCEQVMSVFREYFCRKIDKREFIKKYAYGIKYMYGQTGRKRVQNGYSCSKIIERAVSCGREHGCPFRHWDTSYLRETLLQKGLNLPDIEDIMSLKSNGDYQGACTKCFNATHSETYSKMVVQHPNDYFEQSRNKQHRKATICDLEISEEAESD